MSTSCLVFPRQGNSRISIERWSARKHDYPGITTATMLCLLYGVRKQGNEVFCRNNRHAIARLGDARGYSRVSTGRLKQTKRTWFQLEGGSDVFPVNGLSPSRCIWPIQPPLARQNYIAGDMHMFFHTGYCNIAEHTCMLW